MRKGFPEPMETLIKQFSKMPGIGARSAQRMTFHILKSAKEDVEELTRSIKNVKENIRFCKTCNNLSDRETCSICSDNTRDKIKICVVESPASVYAMEKSGIYNGLYHVLLGELSPIDGVGPDELKIKELVQRVKGSKIEEVIIATDFTTEGETTALYLFEILKPLKVKISRLARGVPIGGTLEYADVGTLQMAFEERKSA
ncbi:MAG: recombination mediator RecR [Candidatus Omnitrophica bacterium]|nr:recombination mediator RecR [Candidatus Omnitrophota bacterium]